MKIPLYTFLFFVLVGNAYSQNDFHLRSEMHPELAPFYHGVASGDPLSDGVIIWTRITLDPLPDPGETVEVNWRVAEDMSFSNVVASGSVFTSESKDFTIKVDVSGLMPYTCYYYDFEYAETHSLIGRTKTAASNVADSLRFAVVSCSDYAAGYFNAYASIVERDDLDAVIHLGDYLYEYAAVAGVDGRTVEPENEIISLSDYRTRHSHYKLDRDLQNMHQQYPMISVWDDHESANDAWRDGAQNHNPVTEGDWTNRKASSKQAYFEWMPIRENTQDSVRLYRKIEYGDLLNLYMCDTRLEGRDEQVGATSSEINDTNRRLLGVDQYDWLLGELQNSSSQWNIVGQQVMMAPLTAFGLVLNTDQWDGYPAERERFYSDILDHNIDNLVVLTGDIHSSWANDLPGQNYNSSNGQGSMGVEFVVTSVTSLGIPFDVPSGIIELTNPHIKWSDQDERGYLIIDVNQERVQGDWVFCDDVFSSNTDVSNANNFYVDDGTSFLQQASDASVREFVDCAQTYMFDPSLGLTTIPSDELVIAGVYPNPFAKDITVQYNSSDSERCELTILDMNGQTVKSFDFLPQKGLNYLKINGEGLRKGQYTLQILTKGRVLSQKVIRL